MPIFRLHSHSAMHLLDRLGRYFFRVKKPNGVINPTLLGFQAIHGVSSGRRTSTDTLRISRAHSAVGACSGSTNPLVRSECGVKPLEVV